MRNASHHLQPASRQAQKKIEKKWDVMKWAYKWLKSFHILLVLETEKNCRQRLSGKAQRLEMWNDDENKTRTLCFCYLFLSI